MNFLSEKELEALSDIELKEYIRECEDYSKLEDARNLGTKLVLNSIYGVMGNPYFRFFEILIAEGITLSGQAMVGWIIQDLNRAMNKLIGGETKDYIVSSDTDSLTLNLSDLVELKFGPHGTYDNEEVLKWVTNFCDKNVNDLIEKSIDRFSEYLNVRDRSVLHMKREVISDSSIFIAKKRYFMSIRDNEGALYERGEELKKIGHEIIKSVTPQYVKDAMEESIKALLFGTKEDYYQTVNSFRTEFMKADPNVVAKTSTVNGISEYLNPDGSFKKGTPKHSRAAINYNKLIQKLDLEMEYPLIKEGDKIKFIGLKQPNPIKSYVLGWPGELPSPLENLKPYFDYDDQFEAIFLKPIESAAIVCGIERETETDENPWL